MEITKMLPAFIIRNSLKNNHFFGRMGKKVMKISIGFDVSGTKNGNSQFFYHF